MVRLSLGNREIFINRLYSFRNKWEAIRGRYILWMLSGASPKDKDADHPTPVIPLSAAGQGQQEIDQESFIELYNELYAPLTLFAKSFVQDMALAEDIIMDVFSKYWERRTVFNSVKDIKAFMYVSVRNSCYDYLRHQQVVKSADHQLEYLFQAAEKVNTLEEVEAEVTIAETMQHIYEAITRLPDRYRRIVELMYFENKSIQEIAEILQIPYQTVVTQRLRALSKLKIKLLQ